MAATRLDANASYADVLAAYETNIAPFESLDQVNTFLNAAEILRSRTPSESEKDGERAVTRDIERLIADAKRARARFTLTATKPMAIVTQDNLR